MRQFIPLLLLLGAALTHAQQLTPDQAAAVVLNSARAAYGEQKFDVAAQRFREFLATYPNHKDTPAARFGLALTQLEPLKPDFAAAADTFRQLAQQAGYPGQVPALYHYGVAQRALKSYAEAAKAFGDAAKAFTDAEWVWRARCDHAEMLLRLGQHKEALAVVTPFEKDPSALASKQRDRGRYYLGYAGFALKDYITAGRALSALLPVTNATWSAHAQYLLARTHHLAGERSEALALYESLTATPTNLDYAARATFHQGVLLYELGRYPDALTKFSAVTHTGLVNEAKLRHGMCQIQLRQPGEAPKILLALKDDPRVGDQALFWLGRAETNKLAAVEYLRQAVARLTDADRRPDYLLELGDAQQSAKQHREAAQTYAQVNNEQALQRLTVAWHQAKAFAESEEACQRFLRTYPKSTLAGAVMWQSAENAYALAEAQPANAALWAEAARRFEAVQENNQARLALGLVRLRLGKPAEAATVLQMIPEAERTGDLALAGYLLAECRLRTIPTGGDDALAAARLVQHLEETARLLDQFIATQPKGPELPEALMKLGWCQQTVGAMSAEGEERNKTIEAARTTYKRLQTDFPDHPIFAQSVFERAKCSADQGQLEKAISELSRFLTEPLQKAPVAPLAVARLAVLWRAQDRAADAAAMLAQCRAQHAATLAQYGWAPLLQYHHALALKDAGKAGEALTLFEGVGTAEALWRAGQCKKDLAAGKPDALRVVAGYFREQADRPTVKELRPRLLYEAAWCWRSANDAAQARAAYEALLKEVPPEAALAMQTRFELAELSEPKPAIPLLRAALDAEPPTELADKIRLRLGDCLFAVGDPKVAAVHLAVVAKRENSPLAADARARWGEALLAQQDWAGAIKGLKPFAEQEPLRRLPGIGERAVLRLGHAYGFAGDWNASRQTFEALVSWFPQSAWLGEARYGIAWSLQNQRQFDPAVEQYRLVTRGTASELAARAQIQIGLCLLANKKPAEAVTALQAVPVTYAYPEWSALALCEAARAMTETGRKDEAATALKQVIERYPNTRGATAAREQLDKLNITRSASR